MSRSLSLFDENAKGEFPSPFLLPSRDEMPMNLVTAMDYCRFLYYATPMYRAVTNRVVGHFVTKMDFRGEVGSPEERREFEQFFREELLGLLSIRELGSEEACYGNGFLTVYFPFVRTLVDRRHLFRYYTLSMFSEDLVKFDLSTLTYEVPDPTAEHLPEDERPKIKLTFRDTPGKDFSKIRLRILDPRYCKLRYSEASGRSQVQYSFKPEHKSRVRRGILHEVNHTPIDQLQAIRAGQDFLYEEDEVYHLKQPTISGVSNEGWGIPQILAHFPTIHKIAVYDRIDESIGQDFMTPLRILSPNLAALGADRGNMIAEEWIPAIRNLVKEQRQERTRIHGFPFQLSYQEVGGNGKQLTPKDVKEYEVKNLLNGLGYPMELFTASLSMQQMPAAIRMFESSFSYLVEGLSGAIRFAVKKISSYMNGEAYDVRLLSSTVADDMERRSLLFNLFSASEIPRRLALEGLGLGDDLSKLKLERAKEDADIERGLSEQQAEEQRRAQLGSLNDLLAQEQQGQQGGNPGAPGGMTPTDTRDKAQQLAQQWLAIPEDGKRSQAMQQVRSTDPDLYAVAKDMMEQMRAQGASQGRQQVAQQAQQGQQPQ